MDARCAGLPVPTARVASLPACRAHRRSILRKPTGTSRFVGYSPWIRIVTSEQLRELCGGVVIGLQLRKHERARAAVQEVAEAVRAGLKGLANAYQIGEERLPLSRPVWLLREPLTGPLVQGSPAALRTTPTTVIRARPLLPDAGHAVAPSPGLAMDPPRSSPATVIARRTGQPPTEYTLRASTSPLRAE
jgi:hypothetical protein